jgi:hypothetical protein
MSAEHETVPTAADTGTLTQVLDAYASSGFDSSFTAVEGAKLECHTCAQVFAAADAPMASRRRLEGASDPADMLAVVALTCPHCGAQGTVVLGFGPSATAEDSDVLGAFRDDRGGDDLPANSAPGEAVGDDGNTA